MPVSALTATTTARNGVGAFIHQCRRLDFHYCDWAGSSRGMNAFLQTQLYPLAARSPSLQIHVSPRPGRHPCIRAHYVTQPSRAISVRNLEPHEIARRAEQLRDASGAKNRRVHGGRVVSSLNDNVRGIWSGLHEAMAPDDRFVVDNTEAASSQRGKETVIKRGKEGWWSQRPGRSSWAGKKRGFKDVQQDRKDPLVARA